MKKRILSVLLCLTLLASLMVVPAFAVTTANVAIATDKTVAVAGDTFVVTVSNTKMEVSSIACTVSFDTSKLEVTSIVDANGGSKYKLAEFADPSETKSATSVSKVSEANGNGNVGYVWVGTDDVVYAAGTISEITFKIKSGVTGSVSVTLSENSAGAGSYKGNVSTKTVTIVNTLTGDVAISGTAKYGESLTASVTNTNNTGTLSYQWKRNGVVISGATNSTYTLGENDIGKTLTVDVTSSVELGTISSAATATVAKADGPAAPTNLTGVACTTLANNDGKITGVNNTMEYKKEGATSYTAITGTTVTGLSNGNYKVRVKATATAEAGADATVSVGEFVPEVLSGTVTILGDAKYGEELAASVTGSNNTGDLSYQWKRNGVAISGATQATYTLTADDIGSTISVEVKSNIETGSISSSATSAVAKADAPAAPASLSGVACSNLSNNDGKITGVDNTMEYKKDGATAWTSISGTSVTGLVNGTYKVRYKETATTKAGNEATVTINEFVPNALIGAVRINGSVKYGNTVTVSVSDTNNTGSLSYQWKLNGTAIQGATGTSYTLTANDIGKALTVEVKSTVETGTLTSASVTVSKANGPSAPSGIVSVACTNSANTNGKLTGLNDKMEYRKSDSTEWIPVTGSSVEGLKAGYYKVRYKETATNLAGEEITVSVGSSNTNIITPSQNNKVHVTNPKKNGYITVYPTNAKKGQTVTITVVPEAGYELDTLLVKGANGQITVVQIDGNTYTFEMPDGAVSVEATYKRIGDSADIPVEENKNPFVDVNEGDYFYNAVLWAVENGVTSGVDANHFAPLANTTRAQMVTFLWRAAGCPIADAEMVFTDVAADAYYYEAVRWAVANGITVGTSETTFSPDKNVTRAQAVTFLYRYAKVLGEVTVGNDNPFYDVAADAYYYEAVLWAVENGVTTGTSEGAFSPDAACTRAQIVTFLYRSIVK